MNDLDTCTITAAITVMGLFVKGITAIVYETQDLSFLEGKEKLLWEVLSLKIIP